MALVVTKIVEFLKHCNNEISDPRVKDWFLMDNPFRIMGVLCVYLYFVLHKGPKLMKNRKPFNVDKIMIVYNILQILGCLYLVEESIRLCYMRGYSVVCENVDPSMDPKTMEIANGVYVYFVIKVVDLLDTVFFVLRKKNNQISFLHVYHHTGMVLLAWHAVKYLPGGQSVMTGFLNCIVHIVMYSYYLLTAFNSSYKQNLWWKKYITQMQIIQFFLIGLNFCGILVMRCGYPTQIAYILIPQNFFMLMLFLDFYHKAYIKKKPIADKKPAVVEEVPVGNKTALNGTVQAADVAVKKRDLSVEEHVSHFSSKLKDV